LWDCAIAVYKAAPPVRRFSAQRAPRVSGPGGGRGRTQPPVRMTALSERHPSYTTGVGWHALPLDSPDTARDRARRMTRPTAIRLLFGAHRWFCVGLLNASRGVLGSTFRALIIEISVRKRHAPHIGRSDLGTQIVISAELSIDRSLSSTGQDSRTSDNEQAADPAAVNCCCPSGTKP